MSWFTPTGPRNNQHWFRVGTVDVTSTVLITGLAAALFVISAFAVAVLRPLYLDSHLVLTGQVWRLVTWPLVNVVDNQALLTVLMFVVFWYFGQSLEGLLGRTRFLTFLALVIVLPAVVITLIGSAGGGIQMAGSGMYFLSASVLVAYAATYPTARSWFGVPFWVITAVILGVNALQLVANGQMLGLLFFGLVIATALIATRSLGLTRLAWIPHVPFPGFMTGDHSARDSRKRRKASHLEVVRADDINSLLDKIAEHGINSLTREERARLDEHSRRRDN